MADRGTFGYCSNGVSLQAKNGGLDVLLVLRIGVSRFLTFECDVEHDQGQAEVGVDLQQMKEILKSHSGAG